MAQQAMPSRERVSAALNLVAHELPHRPTARGRLRRLCGCDEVCHSRAAGAAVGVCRCRRCRCGRGSRCALRLRRSCGIGGGGNRSGRCRGGGGSGGGCCELLVAFALQPRHFGLQTHQMLALCRALRFDVPIRVSRWQQPVRVRVGGHHRQRPRRCHHRAAIRGGCRRRRCGGRTRRGVLFGPRRQRRCGFVAGRSGHCRWRWRLHRRTHRGRRRCSRRRWCRHRRSGGSRRDRRRCCDLAVRRCRRCRCSRGFGTACTDTGGDAGTSGRE